MTVGDDYKILELKERISELEKKVKELELMQETIVETDPVAMEEEIAELREKFKKLEKKFISPRFDMWKQLTELKEDLQDHRNTQQFNLRILADRSINNREVLRELGGKIMDALTCIKMKDKSKLTEISREISELLAKLDVRSAAHTVNLGDLLKEKGVLPPKADMIMYDDPETEKKEDCNHVYIQDGINTRMVRLNYLTFQTQMTMITSQQDIVLYIGL